MGGAWADERRGKYVHVRLSAAEYALLEKLVQLDNTTVSGVIRHLLVLEAHVRHLPVPRNHESKEGSR